LRHEQCRIVPKKQIACALKIIRKHCAELNKNLKAVKCYRACIPQTASKDKFQKQATILMIIIQYSIRITGNNQQNIDQIEKKLKLPQQQQLCLV
jgi:hypothetical protein